MKRITVRLEAPPAHIRVRLKFASSIGEVMTPFTAEHGSIDGAQSAQLQNTGAPSELAENRPPHRALGPTDPIRGLLHRRYPLVESVAGRDVLPIELTIFLLKQSKAAGGA